MVQKYSSRHEVLPVASDYVHWETQPADFPSRSREATSKPQQQAMPGAEPPEPEPGVVEPEPVAEEPQGPSQTKTVAAADVLRKLERVQLRAKSRLSALPGEAAGLLAELVDGLAAAACDFSADQASRVYTSVEAALQRVYDDCTAGAAVVLRQQQANARLAVDYCTKIGVSPNQRGKLRKWEGRLAALARDIEEREKRAKAATYSPLPAALAQRLGSEMFALFLQRVPDSATVAAQKEIVARVDRAVRTNTGHPNGRVHVFGSAASGFGGSGSDIDLCVELPTELARTTQLYALLRQHKARLADIEKQWPDIPRRAAYVSCCHQF